MTARPDIVPYAGVICAGNGLSACGKVDISLEEYSVQMAQPHHLWFCPLCFGIAEFDDDRFEELNLDEPVDDLEE